MVSKSYTYVEHMPDGLEYNCGKPKRIENSIVFLIGSKTCLHYARVKDEWEFKFNCDKFAKIRIKVNGFFFLPVL